MTEINPCPFCGSGDIRIALTHGDYWVNCGKCWAEGPKCDTESAATAAWNAAVTRAELDKMEHRIARLEAGDDRD